jgi:hypothetical protein
MIDHELIQVATIRPARTEAAIMLTIVAMLIIQLAATIRAAYYEPGCVPAIVPTEEAK